MGRQVTIAEAARILGVNRKTIERRIKRGKLTAVKQGRNTIVDLPDEAMSETLSDSGATKSQVSETAAQLLEDMRSERDYWRAIATQQQGTITQLSETVGELNRTVARLTETPALPAPRTDAPQLGVWARLRAWWKGVSEGEQGGG